MVYTILVSKHLFPAAINLISQAEAAAAAQPDPARLLADLIKMVSAHGADPYLTMGILIEGAAYTLAGNIPPERQGEVAVNMMRLLRDRMRLHGSI
jgi:hypothetical protein